MVIAIISIVLSSAAFLFGVFTWRERKSQDQRDLFLKMHERLIDRDLQSGRRILTQTIHSAKDASALFRDSPDQYDLANRSLAMLDVAALYVERGYIDKPLFMAEWSAVYDRILDSAQYFIADREARNTAYPNRSWPHFRALADEARGSISAVPSTEPTD